MALAGRARDSCEGPLAACLLCLAIWAIIIHDVGVVQAADVAGNATLVWTSGFPLTLEFRRAFPISVTMSKAFDFCIPTRGTRIPHTSDCVHEIKYDGYRLRLERDGDRVRLNVQRV
jgi:hypothetical protein